MSKRKTELERKEDTLSVVSVGDHDKVIAFQKKLGVTIGTLIDVLTVGEICVSKTVDIDPNAIESRKVRLSVDEGAFVFVNGNEDDGFGKGRMVKALGETYALTPADMEKVCFKKLKEEIKALEKAVDSLEEAGLYDQAKVLRDKITAKSALLPKESKAQ